MICWGYCSTTSGGELAHIVGGDPDGVFFYVEIGDRWIDTSVFKDAGDVVRSIRNSEELANLLWDAWYAESGEGGIKRWSIMEYDVKDNKCDAIFEYPDEVDVEVVDD